MINQTKVVIKRGDIDFRGYEVVRTQFFTDANMISVTFSPKCIRFSSACVRQFGNVEHIDLLVQPFDSFIAVRPCPAEYKNAMYWAKVRGGKISIRAISGTAFLGTLYELFDWQPSRKYRLRGEVVQLENERIALFDTRETEIIVSRELIPTLDAENAYINEVDNDNIYVVSRSRKFITMLPKPWKGSFGVDYYTHNNTRLVDTYIDSTITAYNDDPNLNPTAPDIVGENMRQLLLELQSGEE